MKVKRKSNIASQLFLRELGVNLPRDLKEWKKTERACSLQLSNHKTFESVHSGGVNSLSLSPDRYGHRYLLSASSRSSIAIHDLTRQHGRTCKVIGKITKALPAMHQLSVETVSWYPYDSGLFISSAVDGCVKIWDTNLLRLAESFTLQDKVYKHQMSPLVTSHALIAAGCADSRVHLINLKSGSATHILKGHDEPVITVAWSTREPYLLASGGNDNRVLLWDIRHASGPMLALDQHGGKQSSGLSRHKTAHNGHVNSMCFTPNGLHLVTYGTDDRVRLWDVATGRNCFVNYGRIANHCNKSVQIAVSDTSKELAFLPTLTKIIAVDIHTGKHVMKHKGAYNIINCCIYEENNQELYTGSNDTFLLAWQPHKKVTRNDTLKVHRIDRKRRRPISPSNYEDLWSSDEDYDL